MNQHQARLLALATANLVLVLLFPPFDSFGLGWGRAQASFDAFYFAFDVPGNKLIDWGLLSLELGWIGVNALLGWLLLRDAPPGERVLDARTGVIVGAVLNLAVMLLLPPFENYASVLRVSGTYFDGFFLVFGDKWRRNFFVPLLYLEVLWLLINAAALWLLCRPVTADGEAPQAEGEAR